MSRVSQRAALFSAGVLATAALAVAAAVTQPFHSPARPSAAAKAGFALSLADSNVNVPAGAQGSDAITIARTSFTGAVALSISGLPTGVTASITPTSTTGNSATVLLNVAANAATGSSNALIAASSGGLSSTVTMHLTVSAGQSKQFAISGSLDRTLYPGLSGRLNLSLTNSNNQPITVNSLSVSISQISVSGCTASNFQLTQLASSAYPLLSIPKNSTMTLSQLNVPTSSWPQVTMLDLPVNQNVCKNATLTLLYAGRAS